MSNTRLNVAVALGVVDLVLSVILIGLCVNRVCDSDCGACECGSACVCEIGDSVSPRREKYDPPMSGESGHPVNAAAASERKQQCYGGQCQPIAYTMTDPVSQWATQYGATISTGTNGGVYAYLPEGQVWNATNQRGTYEFPSKDALLKQMQMGTRPYRPQPQPQPNPQPNYSTQPLRIGIGDRPTQRSNRSHILLFLLPNDDRSEQLKNWFASSPALAEWRNSCTYQEYTPDNRLYQTVKTRDGRRLRDVVPVDEFPAVIWAAPDGGHIHAANWEHIPDSPEQLASDFHKGLGYYQQMESQRSGVEHVPEGWTVTSASYPYNPNCPDGNCPNVRPPYNPDANVNPYCPDGNCPYDTEEEDEGRWRNRNRGREGGWLNGFKPKPQEGFVKDAFWGWLDILVWGGVALMALVLGFLAFIFWLSNRSQDS